MIVCAMMSGLVLGFAVGVIAGWYMHQRWGCTSFKFKFRFGGG